MTYQGRVKDGTIVLEPEVELPEGALVRIELELREGPRSETLSEPLWEMTSLAAETGIRDLATNADHYLYGHPKVGNAG